MENVRCHGGLRKKCCGFALYVSSLLLFVSIQIPLEGRLSYAEDEKMSDSARHSYEPHLLSGSQCEQQLLKSLYSIQDPELKVNIVELGIVKKIECNEHKKVNTVVIILTSPLCPYIKDIVANIKAASRTLFSQTDVRVIVDTETRWTPDAMSEQAKKRFLGLTE